MNGGKARTLRAITRFAPSPTGSIHLGGLRTALFNWLLADATGGRFLLRIEDTDRARSNAESTAEILQGLSWLGLEPDATVHQSQRGAVHRAAAERLLASGTAFVCHMSESDEAEARARARAEGRALRSPWRDGSGDASKPHRVRMRAPDVGKVTITDVVQGDVAIAARDIDDAVLVRGDGDATYTLASVADDVDMGITHIVRGDDHLINAVRQAPLRRALADAEPVFAHVPLVLDEQGRKLSKRAGAAGLSVWRQAGMLPAGLRNYLLLLGWSGGEEFMTDERMREAFDLSELGKSPARFDPKKLSYINGLHLRGTSDAVLTQLMLARLPIPGPQARARLDRAVGTLKTRSRTLAELEEQAAFLLRERPLDLPARLRARLDGPARARLTRLAVWLTQAGQWQPKLLTAALEGFCKTEQVGLGAVGPLLRACLTGGTPAPGIDLVMYWLGREETLGRITDQCGAEALAEGPG